MEVRIDRERLVEEAGTYAQEFCDITAEERDPGRIEATLADQSSLFSHVVHKYELVKSNVRRLENLSDRTRSKVFNEIQETEDSLAIGRTERRVDTDPRVIKVECDLEEEREYLGALRALVRGLEDRRQMLIQIAARQRSEAEHY